MAEPPNPPQDGAFSAYAAGRWDTRQGGYSGVTIHSNDTVQSGPLLMYAHKEYLRG